MEEQWQEMNRKERQEARFERWMAGAGLCNRTQEFMNSWGRILK